MAAREEHQRGREGGREGGGRARGVGTDLENGLIMRSRLCSHLHPTFSRASSSSERGRLQSHVPIFLHRSRPLSSVQIAGDELVIVGDGGLTDLHCAAHCRAHQGLPCRGFLRVLTFTTSSTGLHWKWPPRRSPQAMYSSGETRTAPTRIACFLVPRLAPVFGKERRRWRGAFRIFSDSA